MNVETNPQLSALAFAIGVVALLWVFRRTVKRLANLKHDPDEQSFKLRARSAGLLISAISGREWLRKSRSALRLQRYAPGMSAAQRETLRRISTWQAAAQRRPR